MSDGRVAKIPTALIGFSLVFGTKASTNIPSKGANTSAAKKYESTMLCTPLLKRK